MAVLTRALPCVAAAAVLAAAAPARGSAQLTQDEALELAFPDAEISRRTAFLDEAETRRASELAGPGVEVESSVVTYYVALRGGEAIGVAYFDVHRVRTLPEVLMVVVGTDGRIRELETVSWKEPPEYRPPQGWLRQFQGQRLHEGLSLRGDIAGITGATLTSGAVTRATRRVLALHRVIDPFAQAAR